MKIRPAIGYIGWAVRVDLEHVGGWCMPVITETMDSATSAAAQCPAHLRPRVVRVAVLAAIVPDDVITTDDPRIEGFFP